MSLHGLGVSASLVVTAAQDRGADMDDAEIIRRIHTLVEEEEKLHSHGVDHALDDDERSRLGHLEEQLDQCWDLLRQRRARRHAGENPDEAHARPVDTVEHYLQ